MKKLLLILITILMFCSCAAVEQETEQPQNENSSNISEENLPDEWGITLSVTDVTPTGLTVVFTQSGGNPTGELMTGSYYRLENKDKELAYIVEGDVAWTAEAYMIQKDGETEMQANWEWLYGTLEPGTYRIFKGVTDFRGPGDFDEKEYYAEFTVE